jgi:hypothetical protein
MHQPGKFAQINIKYTNKRPDEVAHVGCVVEVVEEVKDDNGKGISFYEVKVKECNCSLKRKKGSPVGIILHESILKPVLL